MVFNVKVTDQHDKIISKITEINLKLQLPTYHYNSDYNLYYLHFNYLTAN